MRARSRILLSIETINYVHIQNTMSAKEAWDKLREAFDDSGLTRKDGLYWENVGLKAA